MRLAGYGGSLLKWVSFDPGGQFYLSLWGGRFAARPRASFETFVDFEVPVVSTLSAVATLLRHTLSPLLSAAVAADAVNSVPADSKRAVRQFGNGFVHCGSCSIHSSGCRGFMELTRQSPFRCRRRQCARGDHCDDLHCNV
jgi:hypothetical protein